MQWPLSKHTHTHDARSCLELLVCTLAALLAAGSTFSDGQLATLRAEHPGAVGSDGRLRLLAALADTACVDAGKAEVRLDMAQSSSVATVFCCVSCSCRRVLPVATVATHMLAAASYAIPFYKPRKFASTADVCPILFASLPPSSSLLPPLPSLLLKSCMRLLL